MMIMTIAEREPFNLFLLLLLPKLHLLLHLPQRGVLDNENTLSCVKRDNTVPAPKQWPNCIFFLGVPPMGNWPPALAGGLVMTVRLVAMKRDTCNSFQ